MMAIGQLSTAALIWSASTRSFAPSLSETGCRRRAFLGHCWFPRGCRRGCGDGGPVRLPITVSGRRHERPHRPISSECSRRWPWRTFEGKSR